MAISHTVQVKRRLVLKLALGLEKSPPFGYANTERLLLLREPALVAIGSELERRANMSENAKPKSRTLARTAPMHGVRCKNPECGEGVPSHYRSCPVCCFDAGFPNVRAASTSSEKEALTARYDLARTAATSSQTEAKLDALQQACSKSAAVLCRPIGKVHELVQSDNELYASFYQLVEAWSRIPEDNEWDKVRSPVDSLFFPFYYDEIRFAALSLNGQGADGYGGLSMVLQDKAIKARATAFEENTIVFCNRHKVLATGPIPPGYRSTWEERGMLACAKLQSRIDPNTKEEDFPSIILPPTESTTADFIEVHIYGPIHRRAVAKVTGKKPKRQADKVLLQSIKTKFKEINVPVEMI